jgi:enoyl-CoA hydratase/carnithine racemase
MTRYVRVASAGGIGWIVLERPERKNALTAAMWCDLRDAALRFQGDAARTVIVMGSAGAFCAGNDLHDFREQLADPASTKAMHRLMDDTLAVLREIPVPTIAAIDGPCFGAGLSLATACDLRLAS